MAKAEGIPPTASVASVGPGIRYIGQHCYALSGEIIVNNNTVTMLEFTTGDGYIIASFSYGVDQAASLVGSRLIGFTIKLNDIKVFQQVTQTTAGYAMIDFDPNYRILIPAFTNVLIESETTNAGNVPTFAMLAGRVYDA